MKSAFRLRVCYLLWISFPTDSAKQIPIYTNRLFPVRSPLLRKSLLLSFPADTEMVQFSAFPHMRYVFTHMRQFCNCRVAPFGDLCIKAYVQLHTAYRRLSRPSSAPDAKASTLRPY